MTKVKLLSATVILLALINIIALGMLFTRGHGPPGPHDHQGPKKIIIERLDLNADQVRAYEGLIRSHRKEIHELDARMNTVRDELYAELRDGDRARSDSLVLEIGELQQRIELVHFAHFNAIRSLCTADQLDAFNALVKDLSTYFDRGGGHPGPRPVQ